MTEAIANIVTTTNKVDFNFKYNKCKTMEEIDVSLPTLIVGYNIAKSNINGFKILEKCYPEQKLWWTYLKTESRIDYDKDLSDFNEVVINNITENIDYSLIDVINFTKEEKEDIWRILLSNRNKIIYNHYNKFLFIYDKDYKKVYGLPLTTCRFLGKNTDKIIEKLKDNNNNQFIYDFNKIPLDIRRKLDGNIHYLLVLNEYFS